MGSPLIDATTCTTLTATAPPHADLTPFWAEERRISNESGTDFVEVVAHEQDTIRTSAFGGCMGLKCPTVPDLVSYRLCFASRDATVTISTTLGRRTTFYDTQLYIFSVEGDAPPQRRPSVSADAWDPPYDQFFSAPTVFDQQFDDNSGAICSSNDNITANVCDTPGAACEPQPFGIKCPAGTTARLLSKVEFQLSQGAGRQYKCMYANIGAKDAPAGTAKLQFGLTIEFQPPRLLPGCATPSLATDTHRILATCPTPCRPTVASLHAVTPCPHAWRPLFFINRMSQHTWLCWADVAHARCLCWSGR